MPAAPSIVVPSYDGHGLVNLVAELELRLRGTALSPGLDPQLAEAVPPARSYVLTLFDGLGDRQLAHPQAKALSASRVGVLDSPFPSTTTVSMATVATGISSAVHGLVGHLMWMAELGQVVNTLKWVNFSGAAVNFPTTDLLPAPNLWERMGAAGIECVTVQPSNFETTPTTAALYRGCRFIGVASEDEYVNRTLEAIHKPGVLVFTYVPPIDYAAHVWGQGSAEYGEAMRKSASIWERIAAGLPSHAVMVGTADHGMTAIPEQGKIVIRDETYRPLDFWGDPRAVMVRGSERLIDRLASETGAQLIDRDHLIRLLGPGVPHRKLDQRLPDAVLLAPFGKVLLPPGFDKRLVAYHGGLTPDEVSIPLLVSG